MAVVAVRITTRAVVAIMVVVVAVMIIVMVMVAVVMLRLVMLLIIVISFGHGTESNSPPRTRKATRADFILPEYARCEMLGRVWLILFATLLQLGRSQSLQRQAR